MTPASFRSPCESCRNIKLPQRIERPPGQILHQGRANLVQRPEGEIDQVDRPEDRKRVQHIILVMGEAAIETAVIRAIKVLPAKPAVA